MMQGEVRSHSTYRSALPREVDSSTRSTSSSRFCARLSVASALSRASIASRRALLTSALADSPAVRNNDGTSSWCISDTHAKTTMA